MDDVDRAQLQQERELRRALSTPRYSTPTGESAKECAECGDEIPEKRRQAMPGCRLCVDCQQAREESKE